MAEPLKNMYNLAFLTQFSDKICFTYPHFDSKGFIEQVLDETWETLELKQRMRKISETLGLFLPQDYEKSIEILWVVKENCAGFESMILPDFVEIYGMADKHWAVSIKALERFTIDSSSEFAVRPFILKDEERMMAQMALWAKHENEQVRRLASEGCRPRLPWANALPRFKENPTPVLEILELLKSDASLYVRKSVANNLNDISKDHPETVLKTAERWQGTDSNTNWIIRQGCRTLLKQANPVAMALFGYTKSTEIRTFISSATLSVTPDQLNIGETSELSYCIDLCHTEPLNLRIEYAIDFVKSSGKVSRKAFLLTNKTVPIGGKITGIRKHDWSQLTTRKHYPGHHKISLLVNGEEVASTGLNVL